VIFLEYNVDNAPSQRLGRWWVASSGGTVTLPLAMVDSGNQIDNGYVNFASRYRQMVENSRVRPPGAQVTAVWWRQGSQAFFSVLVTNQSGGLLNYGTNGATVHAIVYEDAYVQLTHRFVRSAVFAPITNLANNATASFSLQTPDLTGVDWSKLHFIALVDYRPGGASGAYDMLQAAVASPVGVSPDQLVFMVDPSDTSVPQRGVLILGPPTLTWSALPTANWISVTPDSGGMAEQPQVTVQPGLLANGWQEGQVAFTSSDGILADHVVVRAYLGELERVYLPFIHH
jgi:hypothetical protein